MHNENELEALLSILTEIENKTRYNKINTIFPDKGPLRRELYPKHINFLNATKENKECIFMAANRVGKTLTAAYFIATATTGIYPEWWQGRKWNRPVRVLVAGESSKTVRDVIQYELLGDFKDQGTGLIPKDKIIEIRMKAGTPDAVELIRVQSAFGGISTILFTSYEQDYKAIRGMKLDLVWFDEECPLSYYTEGLMRTMTTNGVVLVTFTPDEGLTETVQSFLSDGLIVEGKIRNKYLVNVGWDDVPHLTTEMKEALWSSIPPHLRSAKTKGIPAVGVGAIYPIDEDDVLCEPFELPPYWPRFFGLDVGWEHPTAAVWFAWDRDSDILYLYSEYKQQRRSPREHALAIKDRGSWIPGVADPSITKTSVNDGTQLIHLYAKEGLRISLADNTVEAGIQTCLIRMQSGRLKIFSTCKDTLQELRLYRREKKGDTVKIVKKDDDLMDAMRYGIMTGIYHAESEYESEDSKIINWFDKTATRNKVTGY